MTKLSPETCIYTYQSGLEASASNLLAVTKENDGLEQSKLVPPPENATLPVLAYFHSLDYPGQIEQWCQGLCRNWGKGDNSTHYCFDTDWDAASVPFSCQQHMVNGTKWQLDALAQASYWMCHSDAILYGDCSGSAAMRNSSAWKILPDQYEIDYCLTTAVGHTCQLQYSPMILYIAIACNAIKFASILLCLMMSRDSVLTTMGDAIDFFLRRPESRSKGRCLMSILDDSLLPQDDGQESNPPQEWVHETDWIERWYQGSSLHRWGLCILLWLACIIVGVVFLCKGINLVGIKNVFTMGFGTLSMNAIVNISNYRGGTSASVLTISLIANLPQLLLSGLYFMYNAVMTGMASAYEWSLFAYQRNTLRVTLPAGSQRETYWLQLPWRYSLPLVACSTVFHWLIAESIFLINLRIYQPNNEPLTTPTKYFPSASRSGVITACGYSPFAIICALGVAMLMFAVLIVVSFWKLKPGIPVVGSCSLAISAACHPPKTDTDAASKPLLWGALWHQESERPGHCCLTSGEVESPRLGDLYA